MKMFIFLRSNILLIATALIATAGFTATVHAQELDQAAIEEAIELRWQAMAEFYESNGMLNTRFDYEEAVVVQTRRGQSMTDLNETVGMLNSVIDYEEAVVVQARRGQAMTAFGDAGGMLNENEPVAVVPASQ